MDREKETDCVAEKGGPNMFGQKPCRSRTDFSEKSDAGIVKRFVLIQIRRIPGSILREFLIVVPSIRFKKESFSPQDSDLRPQMGLFFFNTWEIRKCYRLFENSR